MILLLVLFALLMLLGVEVAFALGLACVAAVLVDGTTPLAMVAHEMSNGVNSYVFLAIPLFLLAGSLMNAAGITDRLLVFARVITGGITGGLALANVVATIIFSWMSGSAVATVGGLGEVSVAAMRREGYPSPFAAAVCAAASTLGPIIPPSIPLILYGAITEQSIGTLFLAAIVPGLLMGGALMLSVWLLGRRIDLPRDERATLGQLSEATKNAALPLAMPVIVLGGLLSGLLTPTEAGAAAVLYAAVLGLVVYRTVKLSDLPRLLIDAMSTAAIVTLIISVSSVFSYLLAVSNGAQAVADAVAAYVESPLLVLLLINVVLLVLGAIMEAGVVLILTTPVLYPVAMAAGIDPVHFGIVVVVNLMIGVATPPIGVSLFVISPISGVKLEDLFPAVLPFVAPLLLVLALVTYVPALSLWLPSLFQ